MQCQMIAGFLTRISSIEGDIALREFLCISRPILLPAGPGIITYGVYTATQTSTRSRPCNPGTSLDMHQNGVTVSPLQAQMIKEVWSAATKYYKEDQNMNKALTEYFPSLLPPEHRQGYQEIIVPRQFCSYILFRTYI